MKNVLVTGVGGFLGSHLAMRHLNMGDRVWGVDDFSSSTYDSNHLRDLMASKRFGFVNGDISGPIHTWWEPSMSPHVHLIYNFACPASPPVYQKDPIHTMMTCVVGTQNVLSIAAENDAVVVHASTSEVYGDPDNSPQRESYRGCVNSYGPRACYDEGKRAAEALCFDYRNKHGVDARLVRIFNTYGPNMDPADGRVVSNFICQALRGEKMTIYGKGLQTRSFCYVDDLIRGIVAMGALPQNPDGPINLGNPHEFTILELANLVGEKVMGTGFESHDCMAFHPLPKDDPIQRCPDISRAKDILGWEPKIKLNDGLAFTIDYFKRVVK